MHTPTHTYVYIYIYTYIDTYIYIRTQIYIYIYEIYTYYVYDYTMDTGQSIYDKYMYNPYIPYICIYIHYFDVSCYHLLLSYSLYFFASMKQPRIPPWASSHSQMETGQPSGAAATIGVRALLQQGLDHALLGQAETQFVEVLTWCSSVSLWLI